MYAAGKFTASNGAKNLVAFNGNTGALIQSFNAPTLKSVLFDSGRILAGSAKLQAFLPNGSKDSSWTVTTSKIDASIRGRQHGRGFPRCEARLRWWLLRRVRM